MVFIQLGYIDPAISLRISINYETLNLIYYKQLSSTYHEVTPLL